MVIFHFSFDLNHFHFLELDLKHDVFWKYFRIVIVSMFVFTSGISLQLTHLKKFDRVKAKKRVLLLGAASLLVSIGSYTQFPNTWIYFGILHFFLFSSIVGLFFIRVPRIAFILGSFILIASYFDFINTHWLYGILKYPLHLPLYYTEDLAKIFPWFGLFLLGMASVKYIFHVNIFSKSNKNTNYFLSDFLSFLGKKSLLIYLIHQPLLFFIFINIKKTIGQ